MISDNIKLVDAYCEIVDARIPYSSRNPDLPEMTGGKPGMIILNRADQADPHATKQWHEHFKALGSFVLETDSKSGRGVSAFPAALRSMLADRIAHYAKRGQVGRKLRIMVLGVPNVGKSSFINRVAKRKAAEASDRPGVTRGKQWISIDDSLELLDTPGILWHRFENQTVAENLAFTGAIRDQVMDTETLAANLMSRLKEHYPQRLVERYKLDLSTDAVGFELLAQAAKNRGFLISGGELDLSRMAIILLDEFRGGKLGTITLEHVSTR